MEHSRLSPVKTLAQKLLNGYPENSYVRIYCGIGRFHIVKYNKGNLESLLVEPDDYLNNDKYNVYLSFIKGLNWVNQDRKEYKNSKSNEDGESKSNDVEGVKFSPPRSNPIAIPKSGN